MEHQKQNVHPIPLLLLFLIVGISGLGINIVEARLGISTLLQMPEFLEEKGWIDSSSRAASRLLHSVPGSEMKKLPLHQSAASRPTEFQSVKRKRIVPPSGPSHEGNSAPFAVPPDQPPPAQPPPPPPTEMKKLPLHQSAASRPTEFQSVKRKRIVPPSGPSRGHNSSPLALPHQPPPAPPPPVQPPPPPPPPPPSPTHEYPMILPQNIPLTPPNAN